MLAAEVYNSPIRHDERIHIWLGGDYRILDRLDLTLEHYSVQGEIGVNPALSASARYLGQVVRLEVDAASRAHVEGAETEIHGIGTCVDRSLQASEVASRREYLRTLIQQVRS